MAKRNYSKMSKKPEPIEEAITPAAPEPAPQMIGVVVGCGKLNVRKEPSTSAEVVCEALLKSELIIDPDKSTDEWFSVCTSAGFEGYCMKKFVDVK